MRKLLLSGVAATALLGSPLSVSAADLGPVYKGPPPPVPYFSWTGLYVGVHVGGGWGRKDWTDPTNFFGVVPFPFSQGNRDHDGFIGGGQIGANYQLGPWVVGAEVDASGSGIDGYAVCSDVLIFSCHTRVRSVGTVTGRLGFAFGNLLLYSKAGAAWANDRYEMQSFFFPNIFRAEDTRWGYTLGTGVEWAFTPNWSVKAEYNYLGFKDEQVTLVDQFGLRAPLNIDQHLHLVKLGVNYRFGGWGGPLSAYASAYPSGPRKGPAYKAPPPVHYPSPWTVETGTRVWFSTGRMQKDLFDPFTPNLLNSRLIYDKLNSIAAEGFFRFDHKSGVFVKGNLGVGDINRGDLNDEDFPPNTVPYSNTLSEIKDSRMRYGSLDVGWNFLNWEHGKVGAFTGYRHFYERVNGFGCRQVAAGNICVPAIPTQFIGLSETETYRAIAVGLNSQVMLWPGVRLEVDAAYLPYANRAGIDNHWFRADINPQLEPGKGWGAQFEAVLSYNVTEKFSIGAGGRYWFFTTTDAYTQFPGIAERSPMKFYTDRYGGFLQASYKFDASDLPFGVR